MPDFTSESTFQDKADFSPRKSARPIRLAEETCPMLAENALSVVTKNSLFRKMNLFIKRIFDVTASCCALVVLAPTFLVIAGLIRLESPGKAIFVQERWGKDMKKIRIYKFRSMYIDRCDASGVVQAVASDTRITRIGNFIRRTNIDELPQLINVVKGDLSIVGPRCHPVGMFAGGKLYEDLVPEYHIRHLVHPGITGLAQSKGLRGPTTDAHMAILRVENDLRYIADMSVLGDIRIIALTALNEINRRS